MRNEDDAEDEHELQPIRPSSPRMPAEETLTQADGHMTTDDDDEVADENDRVGDEDEEEELEDGEEARLNVVDIEHEDYLAGNGEWDEELDKRTRRKLDTILLPFLALLFLLNSLDKSNIGNAETAGFTRDAGLSPHDLNLSMGFFFSFFVALQPVGAAFGRKFGMRRWVPGCMSLWGLCTILHIWVRARWQLILLRIAIATLEAGFYPTTVSYLSLFYTRYEFAVRLGFFYGQTAVAGVLGGVLSWAVFSGFHDNSLPSRQADDGAEQGWKWKSWEVLFLIEGCMTLFVALVGFFWLPRSANTAWFFDAREKAWAERRIQLDRDEAMGIVPLTKSSAGDIPNEAEIPTEDLDDPAQRTRTNQPAEAPRTAEPYDPLLQDTDAEAQEGSKGGVPASISITADAGLTKQDVLSAFLNYKIWHLLICNILSAIPATAFGVFLPLVIKQLSPSLNLSPAASNLLSAPPFACGAVVLFLFTRWSDRSKKRIIPILFGLAVLVLGVTLTITVPLQNYILRYASLCILLSGSFVASPLTVAWLTNNTPEPGKRAILLGINGWGNLAGVFLSVLFTPADRKTAYFRPLLVTLLCVVASFLGFIVFAILLVRENRWRKALLGTWTSAEKEREEKVGDATLPETFSTRLHKRLKFDVLAQKLGLDDVRRGDEKVTFTYAL